MTIRVLACIITRDTRCLVGLRPAHKRHGNLWEFPGGKVEPGESDLEAVRRELREELAVEATGIGRVAFSTRDPGSEFEIHFLPVEIAGEPESIEHIELRWATPGELLQLPLAPSDRRFAEVLEDHGPPGTG
jgi:mutator protein MutT